MCKVKTMWQRMVQVIGWAACIFMGLSASMLAWIMPLTGMAPATYLMACGVASLALAIHITGSE